MKMKKVNIQRNRFYLTPDGEIVVVEKVSKKNNHVFCWFVGTAFGRGFPLEVAQYMFSPIGIDCRQKVKKIPTIIPYCLFESEADYEVISRKSKNRYSFLINLN